MTFQQGDYFYSANRDEKPVTYSVFYCLRRDDENEIAHVKLFRHLFDKPASEDIPDLEPAMMHAPIHTGGFDNPVVFGSKPVEDEDLEGYYAYLKAADFAAYLEETGQDADQIVEQAQNYYNAGNDMMDAGKFPEAVESFSRALEIFPPFFEAADNMAFAYMDMGDYESAIPCFEQSIDLNGHTFLADFSIAECHLRLENLAEAKQWLDRAAALPDLSPEDRALLDEFYGEL